MTKEQIENLRSHLERLEYTQVREAHSIRYKIAVAVQDSGAAARINRLKFNTWFLDPVAKRKRQFDRARRLLGGIIDSALSKVQHAQD